MILDELFSGLSLAEVASIVPIIEKLLQEGKTIIMIEHRLKELFRIASRLLVLNFGMKIAEGSAKEVMESDEVKKAYLGSENKNVSWNNLRRFSKQVPFVLRYRSMGGRFALRYLRANGLGALWSSCFGTGRKHA